MSEADDAADIERMAQAIAQERGCSIELAREAARAIYAEQDDVIEVDEGEARNNPPEDEV